MEVTRELALLATQAAEERKAENVLLLDLKGLTLVADYFVVASGDSTRQVRAIADHIDETLSKAGLRRLHREGINQGKWALLDFGGIVCHVFNRVDRDFYGLERFWGDAQRLYPPASERSPRETVVSAAEGDFRRASVKPAKANRRPKPAVPGGKPAAAARKPKSRGKSSSKRSS